MVNAFFRLALWHFAHQKFFTWFAATMLGVVVGSPDLNFDPSRFAAKPWVPVVVLLLFLVAAANALVLAGMETAGWNGLPETPTE
jgi:hypothetical protein